LSLTLELELGLIQTQMAQKPVLRVEVGALTLRVKSVSIGVERGGMGERGCAGRIGEWVCV